MTAARIESLLKRKELQILDLGLDLSARLTWMKESARYMKNMN